MDFDIQYLIFLQDLRNATGGIFDELFNAISKFAVDILPYLPYVIFWCVGKEWGYRFLAAIWGGEIINGILKLTVCAYRPWIRSDLIEPAGDSKVAATGYSFPSGHTMCATTMYGTAYVWQRNRKRWIAVLCVVMILLTGFSRNFLGVHTPQDVITGLGESILIILIISVMAERIKKMSGRAIDILTAAGVLFVAAVLVYIYLKPYPMDYVDGELLVDPYKMMKDTLKACGGFLGFLIGSFVDRHYIRYEIPEGSKSLPLLTFVGAAIMIAWVQFFAPATVIPALGLHWGNFTASGIMVLFAMIVWPLVIRKSAGNE